MSGFINWFIDSMASEDVIDLYFILSDMVDINLTDEERCETAYFDSMASHTAGEYSANSDVPLGKQVW